MENKKQKLNDLCNNLGNLYEMRQKGDSLQARLEFEKSDDLLKDKGFYNVLAYHFPTNEGSWDLGIDKSRLDYLSASIGMNSFHFPAPLTFKPGLYVRNEKPTNGAVFGGESGGPGTGN